MCFKFARNPHCMFKIILHLAGTVADFIEDRIILFHLHADFIVVSLMDYKFLPVIRKISLDRIQIPFFSNDTDCKILEFIKDENHHILFVFFQVNGGLQGITPYSLPPQINNIKGKKQKEYGGSHL